MGLKTCKLELVPSRLRGDIATFDIKDKDGNVIVEEGRRITARHIRQLEKAGITELEVPTEYLYGRVLAKDMVDTKTGEVLVECNTELTDEVVEKILARPASKTSRRCTPTIWIAVRLCRTPCVSIRPAHRWKHWSKSTA